jgi:hypothetical protein
MTAPDLVALLQENTRLLRRFIGDPADDGAPSPALASYRLGRELGGRVGQRRAAHECGAAAMAAEIGHAIAELRASGADDRAVVDAVIDMVSAPAAGEPPAEWFTP